MSKKSSPLFLIFVLIALMANSCAAQPTAQAPANTAAADAPQEGVITISGAFAIYPLMTIWGEEYSKFHPGVQFNISAGGASKGMTDALSGAVEIGMVSRKIKTEGEEQGAYWVSVTKDAVFPVVSVSTRFWPICPPAAFPKIN